MQKIIIFIRISSLSISNLFPQSYVQGFLQFKREMKFQKRFFVLKGNLLFYFDKKGDKEPVGLLLLEGCKKKIMIMSHRDYLELFIQAQ